MADVFISYASEDRASAHLLAQALGRQGWSVWWDREIVTGEAFDHAIERELEAARSVVVLWSPHSIASEWVKNEAAAAAERGVLLPLRIADVKLPLEFRRKQTTDLLAWQGDPAHEGFQALCRAIAHVTQRAAEPVPVATSPTRPAGPVPTMRPDGRGTGSRWAAIGAAAVVVLLAGVYLTRGTTTSADVPGDVAAVDEPTPGPTPAPAQPPASTGTTTPVPAPSASAEELLADLVAGQYFGDVMSDSQGSSRNGVSVTVTKLDASTVRVTSSYARIGSLDIPLEKLADRVVNAGGDSLFMVELGRKPPVLSLNPRGELAYAGTLRRKD